MTIARARRVFVGLTALHWFGYGLVVPVLILILQARGLGVGTIGVLYTVHAVLTGALELPTGGLADTHGRRRVLTVSVVLTTIAVLMLGLVASLPLLGVGIVVLAVGRALSSGPLEAWFVDACKAVRADVDLTPGLGAGTRALGVGLGLGTLIGGFLPTLAGSFPSEGQVALLSTSVPFVVAALVFAVEVVALRLLTRPVAREVDQAPLSVASSIGEGLASWRRSHVTRRVLVSYAAAGLAATAFEILVPIRLQELTGSAATSAAYYGPLTAVGFTGGALFAGLSGRLRDRAGTPARAALWLTVAAGLGGLLAGAPAIATVIAGHLAVYVLTGPRPALLNTLLHAEIGSNARTVMVSMVSLMSFAGGALGGVAIPFAASAVGTGTGLAIGAAGLALGAVPLLGLRVKGTGDDR